MERREILRYTAYATGAAISLPLMSTILSGCKVDSKSGSIAEQLKFFSKTEIEKVKTIIDIILPKTDSPSASEVGVHTIIDSMVGQVYPSIDKTAYRKNFDALIQHLDQVNFGDIPAPDQQITLEAIDKGGTVSDGFLALRQQTIAYYLSTEEIGKNYLNHLPVPGTYEPCISLESVGGKAWAE